MRTEAYDIEVLPNFFSITFIDIKSYLSIFAGACTIDKKGKKKPIPLVQKYTVKEIKERLDKVKKAQFYITDTDDSQLLPLVGYLNNMCGYTIDKITNKQMPIITHLYGYNSMSYDRLMVAAFLSLFNQCKNTKDLITELYNTSQKIISTQDDKDYQKNDFFLKALRSYGLPYKDIDLMRIFALNKVGKGIDAQGNTIFFSKSLKQTSINLQWYELLEYELPPISDKDIDIYRKNKLYPDIFKRSLNDTEIIDGLNKRVTKWDRYIINEWIPSMMYYNCNDVFICCEMIRLNMDEINLRYNISRAYEVDVLNSSRSNIADKLFEKFYSEFANLEPWQWKGKSTQRTVMAFKKVILPFIEFKTSELQNLLAEMKLTAVTSLGKDSFKKNIKIGNLIYTVATGGLHSQDIPRELKSKIKYINPDNIDETKSIWEQITDDSFIYIHWDINSYYPSLMVNLDVAPEHLDKVAFVKLVAWLRDTRVKAKHSKDDYIDGIPKDILAQALKIVINSIYGKLGKFNAQVKFL